MWGGACFEGTREILEGHAGLGVTYRYGKRGGGDGGTRDPGMVLPQLLALAGLQVAWPGVTPVRVPAYGRRWRLDHQSGPVPVVGVTDCCFCKSLFKATLALCVSSSFPRAGEAFCPGPGPSAGPRGLMLSRHRQS